MFIHSFDGETCLIVKLNKNRQNNVFQQKIYQVHRCCVYLCVGVCHAEEGGWSRGKDEVGTRAGRFLKEKHRVGGVR